MESKSVGSVHWSFWLIGTIALIWNVMGVVNFFVQMNPEILTAYRESERAIIEGRPVWATGAFAVAVLGGTLGCILLLLRKKISFYLFVASLAGVIVTIVHTLSIGIGFSPGEILGIVLMPLVVAGLLAWYSKLSERVGWIK